MADGRSQLSFVEGDAFWRGIASSHARRSEQLEDALTTLPELSDRRRRRDAQAPVETTLSRGASETLGQLAVSGQQVPVERAGEGLSLPGAQPVGSWPVQQVPMEMARAGDGAGDALRNAIRAHRAESTVDLHRHTASALGTSGRPSARDWQARGRCCTRSGGAARAAA